MTNFAKQFIVPKGFLGKLAGKIMYVENRKINDWTLQKLTIRDGQTLLEVGYGPGYAIGVIAEQNPNVFLDGIDLSKQMMEEASLKHNGLMKEGKLNLYHGEVSELRSKPETYDRIYSVNNYPLWESPRETLMDLADCLKKGGKMAITVQPREKDATDITALEIGKQLEEDFKVAGMESIKVFFKKVWPVLAVCVTAEKPH
ncbi:class I SAM-dependent methyltransferase [Neobacillus notoginsengisoli]|uniref:Class I SAM-dependent methyltransferase n=1 Tax=Neobacillus notoginsengisoli TaxID=1578198 RepID=A0A417YXY6_9BACI|nr:class I SAM-dependent methyltransferase [Neobacillus notoginsengisoli]RHW42232.1 class I SAM-dependent methyltransferase [Neobacillus notoginsengisoli]